MNAKHFLRSGISLILSAALTSAPTLGNGLLNYVTAADTTTEIYVSPDGNDDASGTFASPLRTLSAARDAVRELNKNMSGDITVYLRGGDYRITEPVVFDTRDSGTNGHTITYKAYGDEVPVINGSEKVTGWTKYNDKLYSAPLDRNYKLRNLYVNDKRANMGSVRVQSTGGYGKYNIKQGQADWAWVSGTKDDGSSYNPNDIPRIPSNFADLEVIKHPVSREAVRIGLDRDCDLSLKSPLRR